MKTAAAYIRVSTRRQVEEATIVSQLEAVTRYAKSKEYHLAPTHIYRDEGISGARLNRPGLTRLRDAALMGQFGVILCLSADRLSRNLGVQQLLLSEWKGLQVSVIFVQAGRPAETAQEQLLLNIEGAFAE